MSLRGYQDQVWLDLNDLPGEKPPPKGKVIGHGNRIPASCLRKLYGPDHWLNAPKEKAAGVMPAALSDFIREAL